MRAVPFALLSALALTACTMEVPVTTRPVPPAPAPDTCGARSVQGFVGQPLTAFQAGGVAMTARVIRPGQAVTMDFREDRLNVELDASDRIIRIFCG